MVVLTEKECRTVRAEKDASESPFFFLLQSAARQALPALSLPAVLFPKWMYPHPGSASVRHMPVNAHISTYTGTQKILNRPPKRQKQPTAHVLLQHGPSTQEVLHRAAPALRPTCSPRPCSQPASGQAASSSTSNRAILANPSTAPMGAGSRQSHTTTGTKISLTQKNPVPNDPVCWHTKAQRETMVHTSRQNNRVIQNR